MSLPDFFLSNEIIHKRKNKTVFICSIIYILFLYLIQNFIVYIPKFFLYIAIFIFVLPLFYFYFYRGIIRKTIAFMTLRTDGRLVRFLSRRLCLFVFCFMLSFALSFFAVIRVIGMSKEDFIIMSICILSMPFIYRVIARITVSESVHWLSYYRSIIFTLRIATAFTFCIQLGSILCGVYTFPHYASLSEALDVRPTTQTSSHLINIMLEISSRITILQVYLISKLQFNNILHSLSALLFSLISFYAILSAFSFTFIPFSELRRIFIDKYPQTTNLPDYKFRKILMHFIAMILLFGISCLLLINVDNIIKYYDIEGKITYIDNEAVNIDSELFNSINYKKFNEELDALNENYISLSDRAKKRILEEKNKLCHQITMSVENFLDWYYKFYSDIFTPILSLLSIEGMIESKISESFKNIDISGYNSALKKMEYIRNEYTKNIIELKRKYKISEGEAKEKNVMPQEEELLISQDSSYQKIILEKILTSLQIRLAGGAFFGIVGSLGGVKIDEALHREDLRRELLKSIGADAFCKHSSMSEHR